MAKSSSPSSDELAGSGLDIISYSHTRQQPATGSVSAGTEANTRSLGQSSKKRTREEEDEEAEQEPSSTDVLQIPEGSPFAYLDGSQLSEHDTNGDLPRLQERLAEHLEEHGKDFTHQILSGFLEHLPRGGAIWLASLINKAPAREKVQTLENWGKWLKNSILLTSIVTLSMMIHLDHSTICSPILINY